MQVGDKALNVSAGDFVHMPRGTAHSFKNFGNETAKLLMVATPAGIDSYFAEVFFPASDVADIPEIAQAVIGHALKTAPKYGLELLIPAGKQQ